MKTLQELYKLYLSDLGKVDTKTNFYFVKQFIRYSINECYTEFMSQEVLDDWSARSNRESYESYRSRIANIQQFLYFTNRNGHTNVSVPENLKAKRKKKPGKQTDKPFEKSSISSYLDKYIDWIRSTGKYTEVAHDTLIRFNRAYLKLFPDSEKITNEMLVTLYAQHPNEKASSCNERNRCITHFFEFCNWKGLLDIQIPHPLPSRTHYDRIPHAFTDNELTKFFSLIDNIPHKKWESDRDWKFRRIQISVYFRLLFSSGMRTNEARDLKCSNMDFENGIVNIESTKGYHQHRVALHPSMTAILKRYDEEMEKLMPGRIPFFPDSEGGFHGKTWQRDIFSKYWRMMSGEDARAYDLRSNYAVRNINGWQLGEPKWIDRFMYLSRSMGHSSLEATSYYYHLVPMFREKLENQSGKNLKKLLPDMDEFLDKQDE